MFSAIQKMKEDQNESSPVRIKNKKRGVTYPIAIGVTTEQVNKLDTWALENNITCPHGTPNRSRAVRALIDLVCLNSKEK